MAIDKESAKKAYVERASASGDKLVERYINKSGKLAAATSDAAQKSYEEAMRDPKVLKRRKQNLSKLSEEDLNQKMRDKGASNYRTSVSTAGGDWLDKTAPYLNAIDEEVSRLPARSRDPMANVDNRLKPIVKKLSDLKQAQG